MNNAIIRSINTTSAASVLLSPSKHKSCSSVVKFRRLASTSTVSSKPDDMDQNQAQKSNEDLMSHSFGEGYATRSDEEGFGGIYGGNQELPQNKTDQKIHENHPDYDKSQGSEVKEKEKGRHQTNCNS